MNERKNRFLIYMYRVIKSGAAAQGACQLAYSFILAFVPLLIMLVSFLGKISLPADEIYISLEFLLPKEAYEIVRGMLDEIINSSAVGTISIFTFIYFISVAARSVIRITDNVYSEHGRRGGIRLFILSPVYASVIIVCFMLLLVLIVFGELIVEYFFELLKLKQYGYIMYVVDMLRIFGAFALIWGILCLVYAMVPSEKLKIRDVYKGALFATTGWIVASMAFSFYVSNFSDYGILFGSLGGIFVLLVWLYISSYIMILGIYVNRALMYSSGGNM